MSLYFTLPTQMTAIYDCGCRRRVSCGKRRAGKEVHRSGRCPDCLVVSKQKETNRRRMYRKYYGTSDPTVKEPGHVPTQPRQRVH